jgi:hypothetical protein
MATTIPTGSEHIHHSLYTVLVQRYEKDIFIPYMENRFCRDYYTSLDTVGKSYLNFTKTAYQLDESEDDKRQEKEIKKEEGATNKVEETIDSIVHEKVSVDALIPSNKSLLFVTQQSLPYKKDIESCLQFMSKIVDVDMQLATDKVDHCEISVRHLFR